MPPRRRSPRAWLRAGRLREMRPATSQINTNARLAGGLDPTPTAGRATLLRMPEHEPVLATELTDLLGPQPGQVALDCTFGGGGHARRVAASIGPEGTLIAIDRDPAAEERFERFAAEATCRTSFLAVDYAEGLRTLRGEGISPDMVFMDLGMSSMQVDAHERGFSYSYDAPLDMRMDTRQELRAADLVNEWPESRIAQVLRRFGEERYAGGIAREIVRRRPLRTTAELVDAVKAGMPASARFGGGHPAKRTFQAIRIAVNGELDSLDDALPTAWAMLPVGGRLAAISFHSLEDRRVKQFLADRSRGCVCPPELPVCACGREPEAELLTRRAIAPDEAEQVSNPRSKSAHLRAAVKIAGAQSAGSVA
jgi:16S rRNA (cytosine1402-N4)-methyltransferase